MYKRILLSGIILVIAFSFALAAQEEKAEETSDQQISDFSLSGYGERGKKNWDLAGKSADIFDTVVKLKDVVGNMYGDENIKLTADKGDFDKTEGKVHLEDNVVITTASGTKLTTDSLDWDRKNSIVNTPDFVNIERVNMTTKAIGATGHPNLKQVTLNKDVQVDIVPEREAGASSESAAPKDKIVITCDGPLQIDYEKNIATFNNNVKVDTKDATIYSDRMEVYFITSSSAASSPEGAIATANAAASPGMGSKIDKIISKGNVRIVKGENTSYSDEATYSAVDRKILLNGRPKLVIYSTEAMNAPIGN